MGFPLRDAFLLLPDLEELEDLKLILLAAAAPDPERAWVKSSAHSTTDDRVVDGAALTSGLDQAEGEIHGRITALFEGYREIFGAFQAGDPEGCVRGLIRLGEEEEDRGRFERAQTFLSAALRLSLPFADKALQALALRRLGRVLRSRGQLNEALSHYQRSAELARDSDDLTSEIAARIGVGTVLGYQGRWDEAEAVFNGILDRIEGSKIGFSLALGQVYNNLAATATRQDRLTRAEAWFERALEVWERVDSPTDLAVCYHNLAICRKRQQRIEESTEMYHRALELELPPTFRALIATDLAQAYADQGKHGQAREWASEAEVQAIAARSPYSLGHLNYGLGEIARILGDEDGFIFYEKALEIARSRTLLLLEGGSLLGYGLLRKDMAETEEARALLKAAAGIFRSTGMVHEHARAEEALATLTAAPQATVD